MKKVKKQTASKKAAVKKKKNAVKNKSAVVKKAAVKKISVKKKKPASAKKKSAAVRKIAVKKLSVKKPQQPSAKERALRKKHLSAIVSQLREEKLFVQEQVEKAKRDEWMGSVNDEIDNAVASAERDILFERVDRLIQRLDEIDNALKKARLKKFGVCEKCGLDISVKRLKLIPYARFCYRCISKD
ncbi:MAG: hypothetical protein COS41_04250 [Elusimicrobia bacterium CG03_land_8_20_14_0_80_50_18]|nr:MAG: hypothetical protein COS41_04250 [Elusimicrobia bacterium CG03_land_8_20_14_0_80_50_18]